MVARDLRERGALGRTLRVYRDGARIAARDAPGPAARR
jgi:hypothetical protein